MFCFHDAAEVDIHDPNLRSEGGEELSWIPGNSAEFRLTVLDLANQKPRLCDAMLGQAVFLLTDCHELWFRSTQSMEFSWIPGKTADPPAAGIQLNPGNSAEFPGFRRKNQEASIKFVMCPRALWSNLLQQLKNTSANVDGKIQIWTEQHKCTYFSTAAVIVQQISLANSKILVLCCVETWKNSF